MRVTKAGNSKINMCDYCLLEQPTCPRADRIKFGDGKGNDNVVECSEFIGSLFVFEHQQKIIDDLEEKLKDMEMNRRAVRQLLENERIDFEVQKNLLIASIDFAYGMTEAEYEVRRNYPTWKKLRQVVVDSSSKSSIAKKYLLRF